MRSFELDARRHFLLWRRKLRPRAAARLQSYDAAGSARVVSMLTLSPVDVCCSSRFTSCTLQLRLRRSRRRRIVYRSRRGRRRNTVCCSCTSRICWRSRRERVCCARGDKEPLHTEKRPARASRCRQMQAKCTDFRVIRVKNAKIFPRLRRGGPPAAPAASCPMSVCALTGTHQPRLEPAIQ